MSRQSSLAEDRISSDEDEFQEERTGTFDSNGICFRAHSLPTPCTIVHLSFPMARRQPPPLPQHHHRQLRRICTSSGGGYRGASEHRSTKRVPPEPDLIREILAQKPVSTEAGEDEDGRLSARGLEEGIDPKFPLKAPTNTHVATGAAPVRETRSSPALQGIVAEDEEESRKKRKRFKIRSCLIRSCISH